MTPETAFVFPTYRDTGLAIRLINNLRALYPDTPIHALIDGPTAIMPEHQAVFSEHCDRLNVVRHQAQQRLKLSEFGGLWLEQLLKVAIATGCEHIIRTEPDTYHWRKFKSLPNAAIAGTTSNRQGFTHVRGGCVYFRRNAIEQILNSGILRDPMFCSKRGFYYRRYWGHAYPGEELSTEKIALGDLILGRSCELLGIAIEEWNEVDIQFRDEPIVSGKAATHPHR